MKFIKNLLIASLLFTGALLNVNAATVAVTTTAASTNAFFTPYGTNQVFISEITVANGVAQPLSVTLFDAPSTNLTFSGGAYTNFITYATNIVTIFTNFTGIIQTNTNTAVFTETRSIAASTQSYKQLVTLAVGASATVTYKPIDGLTTSYGILSTNNTNCTITVTYSSIR